VEFKYFISLDIFIKTFVLLSILKYLVFLFKYVVIWFMFLIGWCDQLIVFSTLVNSLRELDSWLQEKKNYLETNFELPNEIVANCN